MYSRTQYTGTGATSLYAVPFPHISRSYVKVSVGGVLQTEGSGYSWVNTSTIQLSANLASGVILDIRRETPKDVKLVDYQDGSVLDEATLDLSADQTFQMVQEMQGKRPTRPHC